jgi:DNA-binding CsgD family transcriptional regulator
VDPDPIAARCGRCGRLVFADLNALVDHWTVECSVCAGDGATCDGVAASIVDGPAKSLSPLPDEQLTQSAIGRALYMTFNSLTPDEQRVSFWSAVGYSTNAIARRLGVSDARVEALRESATARIRARVRLDAARTKG